MSIVNDSRARAVADLTEGLVLASVEVAAAPERVQCLVDGVFCLRVETGARFVKN